MPSENFRSGENVCDAGRKKGRGGSCRRLDLLGRATQKRVKANEIKKGGPRRRRDARDD